MHRLRPLRTAHAVFLGSWQRDRDCDGTGADPDRRPQRHAAFTNRHSAYVRSGSNDWRFPKAGNPDAADRPFVAVEVSASETHARTGPRRSPALLWHKPRRHRHGRSLERQRTRRRAARCPESDPLGTTAQPPPPPAACEASAASPSWQQANRLLPPAAMASGMSSAWPVGVSAPASRIANVTAPRASSCGKRAIKTSVARRVLRLATAAASSPARRSVRSPQVDACRQVDCPAERALGLCSASDRRRRRPPAWPSRRTTTCWGRCGEPRASADRRCLVSFRRDSKLLSTSAPFGRARKPDAACRDSEAVWLAAVGDRLNTWVHPDARGQPGPEQVAFRGSARVLQSQRAKRSVPARTVDPQSSVHGRSRHGAAQRKAARCWPNRRCLATSRRHPKRWIRIHRPPIKSPSRRWMTGLRLHAPNWCQASWIWAASSWRSWPKTARSRQVTHRDGWVRRRFQFAQSCWAGCPICRARGNPALRRADRQHRCKRRGQGEPQRDEARSIGMDHHGGARGPKSCAACAAGGCVSVDVSAEHGPPNRSADAAQAAADGDRRRRHGGGQLLLERCDGGRLLSGGATDARESV